MNDSAYKISLDINAQGSQVALNAKKSDTGRKIYISLRAGGTPYTIADDCYAVFAATKPDGSILYNACTIEGNEIVYEFTEQTCAAVGKSRCEIKLYGSDDKLITSPRFTLLVDGTVYPDEQVESTDEFSALTKLVSDTVAATNNANDASKTATNAAQGANEAASTARSAADTATTAAGNANTAASAAATTANTAADNANKATANAKAATQNANTAAGNANTAASAATEAAENANETMTDVVHIVKNTMAAGEVAGESVSMNDAVAFGFIGCRIFGKTTQNGTPTPDAPVDLVSVGDNGSITVNVTGENDAQSMTVATPNGLPGIPVTSGGNYTDANGQQWICDEIDFARGVYVKRTKELNFNGSENWDAYISQNRYFGFYILGALSRNYNRTFGLCNQFTVKTGAAMVENVLWLGVGDTAIYVLTSEWYNKGLDAWKQHISANPLKIIYPLETPIETPLSEEDLAAYAALRTYKDHTTVSNDASAYMELEYVMDAKKYIDSMISASGIIPATVE